MKKSVLRVSKSDVETWKRGGGNEIDKSWQVYTYTYLYV
jgi:hypothetical protein